MKNSRRWFMSFGECVKGESLVNMINRKVIKFGSREREVEWSTSQNGENVKEME